MLLAVLGGECVFVYLVWWILLRKKSDGKEQFLTYVENTRPYQEYKRTAPEIRTGEEWMKVRIDNYEALEKVSQDLQFVRDSKSVRRAQEALLNLYHEYVLLSLSIDRIGLPEVYQQHLAKNLDKYVQANDELIKRKPIISISSKLFIYRVRFPSPLAHMRRFVSLRISVYIARERKRSSRYMHTCCLCRTYTVKFVQRSFQRLDLVVRWTTWLQVKAIDSTK
jgi:hypothetical protein